MRAACVFTKLTELCVYTLVYLSRPRGLKPDAISKCSCFLYPFLFFRCSRKLHVPSTRPASYEDGDKMREMKAKVEILFIIQHTCFTRASSLSAASLLDRAALNTSECSRSLSASAATSLSSDALSVASKAAVPASLTLATSSSRSAKSFSNREDTVSSSCIFCWRSRASEAASCARPVSAVRAVCVWRSVSTSSDEWCRSCSSWPGGNMRGMRQGGRRAEHARWVEFR